MKELYGPEIKTLYYCVAVFSAQMGLAYICSQSGTLIFLCVRNDVALVLKEAGCENEMSRGFGSRKVAKLNDERDRSM